MATVIWGQTLHCSWKRSSTLIAAFLCSADLQSFILSRLLIFFFSKTQNCIVFLNFSSRFSVWDGCLSSSAPPVCVWAFFLVGGGEVLICSALRRRRSSYRPDMEAPLLKERLLKQWEAFACVFVQRGHHQGEEWFSLVWALIVYSFWIFGFTCE